MRNPQVDNAEHYRDVRKRISDKRNQSDAIRTRNTHIIISCATKHVYSTLYTPCAQTTYVGVWLSLPLEKTVRKATNRISFFHLRFLWSLLFWYSVCGLVCLFAAHIFFGLSMRLALMCQWCGTIEYLKLCALFNALKLVTLLHFFVRRRRCCCGWLE